MTKNNPRVLIITADAGGGHIQAAKAKRLQIEATHQHPYIITRDIVIEWIGKWKGKAFCHLWNHAQRTGNVFIQRCIYTLVPICDTLFSIKFMLKTIVLIMREDIDYVVDTQTVGLRALVRATYFASKLSKRYIYLEKVFVELPTDKTKTYYRPLRGIHKRYLPHLKIQSASPLLTTYPTSEAFWKGHCRLSDAIIDTTTPPVRPAFLKTYKKNVPLTLDIELSDPEETQLVASALTQCTTDFSIQPDVLTLTLPENAHVTTLMLGSIPCIQGAQSYVTKYLAHFKENEPDHPHYLFVFCSHKNANNSLLHILHQLIDTYNPLPKNVCILPLYFQDDHVIAPLMARSQVTITRSGAITSHELLRVANGTIFIHSECKSKPFTQERMKTFMPIWEEGNAEYLIKEKQARVINPQTFIEELTNSQASHNPHMQSTH